MGFGVSAAARRDLGNRLWRIETPAGRFIQKLHRRRRPWLRSALRWSLGVLARVKTLPDAASRRRTEGELLALWQAAGFDVPRVFTAAEAGLAPGPALLMEDVPGRPLPEVLHASDRATRDLLLVRAGGLLGVRSARAEVPPEPRSC